jgi:hypothetical protein
MYVHSEFSCSPDGGPATVAHKEPTVHDVVAIETPDLGDRSYLVHDGRAAVMIDPQRDADRVAAAADAPGAQVAHVLETHIRTGRMTGGLALYWPHGRGLGMRS